MNYRHAFHAGNFADVAKHLALIGVLCHLRKKDAPFVVIDTHAGRGLYDLSGPEAVRTNEAGDGILRLRQATLTERPELLAAYLAETDGSLYPGSPLISARHIRVQDRLVAVEKHPEDAAALRDVLRPYSKARVEEGDGFRRLCALVPPPERRGLILIDPPFEAADEFAQTAKAFAAAYRRFATGVYVLWFPIKSASEANRFCSEILSSGAGKVMRIDVTRRGGSEGKLAAAGLVVVNPPWQFEEQMRQSLAVALPHIDADARFEYLAGAA